MTDVVVLEHPLSPYAQKVKLALMFKGVPFDARQPEPGADLTLFLSASPRSEVPVLQHGDVALYDSSVICAYIEERWPAPTLLPEAPEARARARLIEAAMDTHFEGNTWGLGEVRIFGRAEGERADAMCRYAEVQIRGWYAWLETQLPGPWFNGEQWGWADLSVIPFVNGAARFDILPEPGSVLSSWLQRANEREDVAEVTRAAKAAELDPDVMRAAIESGFKREYRDHRLEWMVRAGGVDIVAAGIDQDNIRFNPVFGADQ